MTASSKRQKREEYRKTHKDSSNTELPKKKFYRQRAHANPFSDHQLTYPASPSQMDWSPYYPAFVDPKALNTRLAGTVKPLTKPVTIADIGCGFGGLLIVLSPLLPEELILGLEIRTQVTEYVQDRISALRWQHPTSAIVSTQRPPDRPGPFSPPYGSNSVDTKQYIIWPSDEHNESQLAAAEIHMKRITNFDKIHSYRESDNALVHWVLDLTDAQLQELHGLDGIDCIEENPTIDPLDDPTSPPPLLKSNADTGTGPHKTTSPSQGPCQNISVLRANTMKFLPNFFKRGQLSTMFLCFPDPHFKARKHKARIVSSALCAEYAYVMKAGGCVYTITDVEELGGWMRERFEAFGKGEGAGVDGDARGLFERVEIPEEGREGEWEERGGEEARVGTLVRCIREETEEGKKVSRNRGKKFVSVWRRREDPEWPGNE